MKCDLPPKQNATSAGAVSGALKNYIGRNITQERFSRFPLPDQGLTFHLCACGNVPHSFTRLGDVTRTVLLRLEGQYHGAR